MGRRFKAKVLKKEWPGEHGCTITEEYLDYLVNDVEATWSLYQAQRAVYEKHKLPTPAWEIYSEASIGKAYLEALGIPRFMVKHYDFPRDVLGQFMSAYYGGRSEVRVRLQPAEVAYCDFKQYPTVNAVMNLQALHLAEHLEVRHCADEVRAFMNGLTLDMLREKATWLNLVCIVKVIAKSDILPVRTAYGEQSPAGNIGINYVTCARPTPYTLADVIASWLLTGKVPEIADAIEIVPQGQVPTNKLDFFGDERFPIDLAQHDLFTRVIDLRSEMKKQCDDYKRGSDEHASLDGTQKGLKLMAASTSYGVAAEVIVEERSMSVRLSCIPTTQSA